MFLEDGITCKGKEKNSKSYFKDNLYFVQLIKYIYIKKMTNGTL